ncbi:MAG: hypothetical protein WBW73_27275 [Rhodoplanes sp.]
MVRTLGTAALVSFSVIAPLGPAAAQNPIECRAKPESREYWSWREIEGRRCWYKGRRRIDKKLLSWGPSKPAEGPDVHPATLQEGPSRPSSTEQPIEAEPVYQPTEPSDGSMGLFETVWRNLMTDMKFQDRIKMEEADPPAR